MKLRIIKQNNKFYIQQRLWWLWQTLTWKDVKMFMSSEQIAHYSKLEDAEDDVKQLLIKDAPNTRDDNIQNFTEVIKEYNV